MHKIILAGYGGQGMLLVGQILALAAMNENKNVTWLPSYGPEMRGGAAFCNVIVSDLPIGSPVIQSADVVVAMNQPSFDKFEKSVAPGGTLIYNTSLVMANESRDDITYYSLDCSKIAMELGNMRVANMIALGALNAVTGCVSDDSVIAALSEKFGDKKASMIEINKNAIERGRQAIRN